MSVDEKELIDLTTSKVILFCDKHNMKFVYSNKNWYFIPIIQGYRLFIRSSYDLSHFCETKNKIVDCVEIVTILSSKVDGEEIGCKILKAYNPEL